MKKTHKIRLTMQRTAFALYAVLIIVMATATIVEDTCGTAAAHNHIYGAWWFELLWALALICSLPCITSHLRWAKRLIKRMGNHRKATVVLLLLGISLTASATRVVERAQADSMMRQQVVYNGRICPLNTPARDFVLKLTGSTSWRDLTPEQVILSWALYPEDWKDVAMIRVKKAALRDMLGIEGRYAKFADFFDAKGNYKLRVDQFPDIDERLTLIVLATKGELFRPLPEGLAPISQRRICAELIYNAVPWDIILFASCFTLAFFIFFIKISKHGNKQLTIVFRILTTTLVLLLVLSLGLRWYISDHIPVSNTYETLQTIALTALVIASVSRRYAAEALLVSAATLLVAHLGALDPQVTPLMPVLQSPWLSSHVTTIMISYCLFAMLLFRPNRAMLIWAETLLGIGIILGSVWAKTAWGTYWSWDPKETWALISFLIYMYPLHPRILPWFQHEKHLRLYLRLAFLTILMTYFGCNYLLSGLHSYAG